MMRNYLVILYRNLVRQLSYSIINIAGLAIGLACSIVIFSYVYGEWSYDRGFTNGDRVYRIGVSFFNIGKFAIAPERLLTVLPAEFAGIETATRVGKEPELIRVGNEDFSDMFVFYTDSAYFHVFDYAFVEGNPATILKGPNEAVLTEKMAEKLFGKKEVLGEVVAVGKDRTPFKIAGIVREPEFNTHLSTGIWLSIQGQLSGEQAWSSAAFHNYVLLRKNVSEADLNNALDKIIEKHVFPEFGKTMGITTLESYLKNDNAVKFYVHPFRDIYLHSRLNMELTPGGSETNIIIFSGVSIFILVLAAVNFINLTTARASRRAKEVGIRKAMGTSREKLIIQFLTESVVTSTISMGIALGLAEAFLVLFTSVTGSAFTNHIIQNPVNILWWTGFSILVGLISGLYPAFYLTAFTPVKVLKGNLSAAGGNSFRNFLVVFQFSVSIILIICTILVVQQLKFMQSTDLGFDQQNIVVIDQAKLLGSSAESFKTELLRENGVERASFHGGEPGSKKFVTFQLYQTPEMHDAISINTYLGDAEYCSLMGFHLVSGRVFSKDIASDTMGIVLNEAAVKLLGLGENPIGATVNKDRHVIGIVSNFHWESLRNEIGASAILFSSDKWKLGFKLSANAIPAFLKKAEARWKQAAPQEPFRYHFMDSNFGELMEKEKIFGNVITFFTMLAIFISCLGLYGLAAFTAEQRTKEIGIRKVLGASPGTIIKMLNRKFTRLVLISIVVAIPVSTYCMSRWLEGFAYKISMSIWTFIGASLGALLIALFAVSYHSLKAALIDPAKTLKYE